MAVSETGAGEMKPRPPVSWRPERWSSRLPGGLELRLIIDLAQQQGAADGLEVDRGLGVGIGVDGGSVLGDQHILAQARQAAVAGKLAARD